MFSLVHCVAVLCQRSERALTRHCSTSLSTKTSDQLRIISFKINTTTSNETTFYFFQVGQKIFLNFVSQYFTFHGNAFDLNNLNTALFSYHKIIKIKLKKKQPGYVTLRSRTNYTECYDKLRWFATARYAMLRHTTPCYGGIIVANYKSFIKKYC